MRTALSRGINVLDQAEMVNSVVAIILTKYESDGFEVSLALKENSVPDDRSFFVDRANIRPSKSTCKNIIGIWLRMS